MTRRIFTIDEARAALPAIKEITDRYHGEVEEVRRRCDEGESLPGERIEHEIERRIRDWSREVLALGAEPKGLWLVDFDSGDGFYFCWQRGEDEIEHIHSYEAGFAGRRKIGWRTRGR